jgi:predicted nucleic acid-binding protein
MSHRRHRPVDFAHAILVPLARRESLSTIFTIDHNDFEPCDSQTSAQCGVD